jgi:DNA-binding MarR family transcriptional regulator
LPPPPGKLVRTTGEGLPVNKYPALERELGLLMRRGASLGREIAVQMHPELDSVSYSTLARIAETKSARASDLADYFGIHKAVVSRQLRELERLSLVERTPDPADGRARLLRLTRLGTKRMRQVQEARAARFRALVQAWPPSDVDELARLLGKLNHVLETGERLHPLAPPR